MVKIRTVVPDNAKPGLSVIQVVHPKTGRPSRVRVPSDAKSGQVIELELPDEPGTISSPQSPTISTKQTIKPSTTKNKEDGDVSRNLASDKSSNLVPNVDQSKKPPIVPKSSNVVSKKSHKNIPTVDAPKTTFPSDNVAQTPPPTQLPPPPFPIHDASISPRTPEKERLLGQDHEELVDDDEEVKAGCCISCLMKPVYFFRSCC